MAFKRILVDTYSQVEKQWCWRDEWAVLGESAWTLLYKFARLNQLTAREFMELAISRTCRRRVAICTKPMVDLREDDVFDLAVLSEMFRMPLKAVRNAFLYSLVPGSVLRSCSHLRWCQQCLDGGFHSPLFQLRCTRTCPIHQVDLLEHCMTCKRPIPYQISSHFFLKPFSCPHCATALAPALAVDRPVIRQMTKGEASSMTFLLRFHRGADADIVSNTDAERLFAGITTLGISHVPLAQTDIDVHFAGFIAAVLERIRPSQTRRGNGLRRVQLDVHECGCAASCSALDDDRDEYYDEDDIAAQRALSASQQRYDDLVAVYKALRRRLWRKQLGAHKRCAITAARALWWDLRGERTIGFCSEAQAFLQWRMLWEGSGTPRTLMTEPSKDYFGILGWHLARRVPMPAYWSPQTKTWVTRRIFASTLIDSFARLLQQSRHALSGEEVEWRERCNPIHLDCLWAVTGSDCRDEPARIYTTSTECGAGRAFKKAHWARHLAQVSQLRR